MALVFLPPHKLAPEISNSYNVRQWGGLLCLKLYDEFCKISQPVQILRWLDTPTDSMDNPENVYVA